MEVGYKAYLPISIELKTRGRKRLVDLQAVTERIWSPGGTKRSIVGPGRKHGKPDAGKAKRCCGNKRTNGTNGNLSGTARMMSLTVSILMHGAHGSIADGASKQSDMVAGKTATSQRVSTLWSGTSIGVRSVPQMRQTMSALMRIANVQIANRAPEFGYTITGERVTFGETVAIAAIPPKGCYWLTLSYIVERHGGFYSCGL
jgi:hypothetical protein